MKKKTVFKSLILAYFKGKPKESKNNSKEDSKNNTDPNDMGKKAAKSRRVKSLVKLYAFPVLVGIVLWILLNKHLLNQFLNSEYRLY